MTPTDVIAAGAACVGSIYTIAKILESSLKKTIRIETESIRETLSQHTEALKSIREQTTKTNGRVNGHDDRLLCVDKALAALEVNTKPNRRKAVKDK